MLTTAPKELITRTRGLEGRPEAAESQPKEPGLEGQLGSIKGLPGSYECQPSVLGSQQTDLEG